MKIVRPWPKSALFVGGVFFGGGMDHAIFVVTGASQTHYGLTVPPVGQVAFALFDFGVAALLCVLHARWSGSGPRLASGR
jgi:hypothetical protein